MKVTDVFFRMLAAILGVIFIGGAVQMLMPNYDKHALPPPEAIMVMLGVACVIVALWRN